MVLHAIHDWASQAALVVKNPPANEGGIRDIGSIPGSGRSLGKGNGKVLRYSCLGNPVDRGDWWATVHGVTKRPLLLLPCSLQNGACNLMDACTFYFYRTVSGSCNLICGNSGPMLIEKKCWAKAELNKVFNCSGKKKCELWISIDFYSLKMKLNFSLHWKIA